MILGESLEESKIKLLVPISICFMDWFRGSKYPRVLLLLEAACCGEMLHSKSYWKGSKILEADMVWRESQLLV